jgi:hypothetical protein
VGTLLGAEESITVGAVALTFWTATGLGDGAAEGATDMGAEVMGPKELGAKDGQ